MADLHDVLPLHSTWQHHYTKQHYKVTALTNLHSTQPKRFPQTVVYEGGDKTWSRPVSDFLNKFTRIE